MTALPGWWDWRKMRGARYIADRGPVLDPVLGRVPDAPSRGWEPYPGAAPDPSDPATIGCLTALVREMWGEDAHVGVNHRDPSEWIVWARLGAAGWWSVVARGPTEWSALMAAGDAAWARRGGGS